MPGQISSDPWRKPVGRTVNEGAPVGTGEWVLEVESGAVPGRFPLRVGAPVIIGRGSTLQTTTEHTMVRVELVNPATLVIQGNPHVSSRHVSIESGEDGRVFVTDLGSSNGTYCGDPSSRLSAREPVELSEGDRLILCQQLQVAFVLRKET